MVDADLDGPTPWLATAYVAGHSLADAIGRHGPPVTAVRVLAAGLAEGLATTLNTRPSGGPDGRTGAAAGDQGKIYLWTIR